MSKVATRFAPSPTGPLHIGGIRTALFNWLYSKNQKGSFHLRIEDTDKERSKDEYKNQIIESLKWIGINHEENVYIQSSKIKNHIEIVNQLLKKGFAYKCYCSEKEIEEEKNRAKQKKLPYIYNRKCRERKDAPNDIKPVIRFKSKIDGETILKDMVQGEVKIENSTIEDFIILRKDENQFYSQEIKSTYADADKIDLNINDKIFVYESTNYRNSPTYRVEGEVNKPGTYPLKKGITVEKALSLAGGLTELSTINNIIISQEFTEIDETDVEFTEIKNVANFDLDFELSSNSVIKALPYENVVSVEGNVYNPGLVAFTRGITMTDAIIQAGGYKPNSMKNRAYVKKANGEVSKANHVGKRELLK